MKRAMAKDSPYYVELTSFANEFVKTDPEYTAKVLFDHATNDWRDVIRHKINVPTLAIFSASTATTCPLEALDGSTIPNAGREVVCLHPGRTRDHFLMFKNPFKFTEDLRAF